MKPEIQINIDRTLQVSPFNLNVLHFLNQYHDKMTECAEDLKPNLVLLNAMPTESEQC